MTNIDPKFLINKFIKINQIIDESLDNDKSLPLYESGLIYFIILNYCGIVDNSFYEYTTYNISSKDNSSLCLTYIELNELYTYGIYKDPNDEYTIEIIDRDS